MTIIYEINPPKIPDENDGSSSDVKALITKLEQRVSDISSSCGGIHITDSVLGTRRVSPLTIGKILKKNYPHLQITVSMRVRDRTMSEIKEMVKKTIEIGLDGILVLKGDPSKNDPYDSGLVPSQVVRELNKLEFADKMDFFLSLPSNPDFEKIQKKISANPIGFMTQVIHSAHQIQRISEKLKPQGFRVIPCILLPSEKNNKSAEFLRLDWSEYKKNPAVFIRKIHQVAGDVLITSPSDFEFAKVTLKEL